MESAATSPAHLESSEANVQNESVLLSSQSVLDILRLNFAGAPLAEVLAIMFSPAAENAVSTGP